MTSSIHAPKPLSRGRADLPPSGSPAEYQGLKAKGAEISLSGVEIQC